MMRKSILIFIISTLPMFGQNFIYPDSVSVIGVIYTDNGIFLETKNKYLQLYFESENLEIEKNVWHDSSSFKNSNEGLQLIKFFRIPSSVIKFNKVSFQQAHSLSLFFTENDFGKLALSTSARAIIDLLIFSNYSTTDSPKFTFHDRYK